ncbi:putative HTH-type transcriptional regulator AraC [Nocardioides flavus (ex Wang et al. 2016)]|uniref:HTH-type transcriptional regulator AraC n=1 Tax=Nocardioides flavus (ex Wang et al. 2016) TaxID=2058780 RepID=A0ABQ3HMV7_9ACTN|nr:AraC family transcriptional regulator [Nocardioides flavus (ex Wang et al. 2016)]GHE18009.1 putative HTH-type transcriptional regulator AraC [Nocardioides flavus (ex Wang et al. 2016)]
MRTDEPGVPSLAFVQLLSSPAIDADAVERFRVIMAREGTGELALIRTQGEAPLRWFREVYPDLDIEQATRLGIACAEHAQLTSFGPLSVPLVSACTVEEVVELLTYLPLITNAVTTQFQPQQDDLTIRLSGNAGDPDLDCLVVTYCGLALLRLIDLVVVEASEATMHSHWPEPSVLPREAASRSRLGFDAPFSYLHMPARTLQAACRFPDPISYELAVTELQQALARRADTPEFTRRVWALLDDGSGARTIQSVADEFSMSSSTLKRRLAAEGTSFRELLQQSMVDRARKRLLDPSTSVGEVANELGYSDLTNFSHAFKKWTGSSPSHFRREHEVR